MSKRTFWWIIIVRRTGRAHRRGDARRARLPVEVAPLTRGPMRVTIDEEGRTQVKRRYVVSAPLAGKLLRIELKAGDRVDEGAVLARLVPADAPLLDPRARAEQEARLHASEAAVAQAERRRGAAARRRRAARATISARKRSWRRRAPSPRTTSTSPRAKRPRACRISASAEFGAKVADHQLAEARAALQRGRSGASTSSRSWRRCRARCCAS